MKKIVAIGCVIYIVLSCHKEKTLLDRVENITGEYIWSYSAGFPAGSSTTEKYAVSIDEKGKLYLFEGNEEKYRYKINACEKVNDSLYSFNTKTKSNPNKPIVSGTILLLSSGLREMNLKNYPYAENYYYENN